MARCLSHTCKTQMANWGSLWFRKMARKNFGKDVSNLWWRIWFHSLPRPNKWLWLQEASNLWCRIWYHSLPQQKKWLWLQEGMQICWTKQQFFFFLQKLIAPPPPPPTALSLSLPFLLSIFPHNFLFCFLLLTRNLIFGEEIHPEKITPHGGIEPLISGWLMKV
jgi:hypothetical protein